MGGKGRELIWGDVTFSSVEIHLYFLDLFALFGNRHGMSDLVHILSHSHLSFTVFC